MRCPFCAHPDTQVSETRDSEEGDSIRNLQATGWNVTAYPVDYRTSQDVSWWSYSLAGGATQWKLALHELAGLLAYRLIGVI